MTKSSSAIICIPTYNEIENIERIVPAVLSQVPEAHILVIDDASPDGTGQVADELANADSRVHVLHREKKEGLGRAYLAAFSWALERGYERIVEFDADFSHNPIYLPVMLDHLARTDVVIGSRRVPGGGVANWSPLRKVISAGGSLYAKTVLGVSIKDLTGGFNGFRADSLLRIDYKTINATGYMFQIEIKYRCAKSGMSVFEMPIVFPDRERGTSKMSSNIFREAFIGVWKLRLGL